jgi:hypothetical protein
LELEKISYMKDDVGTAFVKATRIKIEFNIYLKMGTEVDKD